MIECQILTWSDITILKHLENTKLSCLFEKKTFKKSSTQNELTI